MSAQASLLLAVVLLLGNGFFVGAEFAVLSARRSQIEPLAQTSARARSALVAMEHVSLMLATCQLGVTLCSLGLGAVAEPALAHLLEPLFHAVHLPEFLLHPVSLVIALSIVTYLHVVVGEPCAQAQVLLEGRHGQRGLRRLGQLDQHHRGVLRKA